MALNEVVAESELGTIRARPAEPEADRGAASITGHHLALRPPSAEALVLYGSFAFAVALTFGYSPDDPFITLRYAWNLVHGHGLVFNQGEHVNGATSPIGVALAVVALLLPLGHTYFKLKLLSLLFGVLTLGQCRRLVQSLLPERWTRMLALLAIGSSASIAISAASGLETTFYSFALVGLLTRLCDEGRFGPCRGAASFATLAVLARPEAIGVVGALGAFALIAEHRLRPWARIRWAGGAILVEAMILLANRVYYKSWLPNTYYAKHMTSQAAVTNGYQYLRASLDPVPSLAVGGQGGMAAYRLDGYVLIALLVLAIAGFVRALLRWRSFGYLLAAFAAQACFVVMSGGDWMHGARFIEPVIVVLYVLQALGAAGMVGAIRASVRPSVLRPSMLVLITFGLVGFSSVNTFGERNSHDTIMALSRGVGDRSLLQAGGYENYSQAWALIPSLMACAQRGALVASTEVGFLSFSRPDLRVLDLRGLTNSQIARTASPSMKFTWGVQDNSWWRPTSPVGQVILRERPSLIATVDPGPSVALDATYSELGVFSGGVALYDRTGMDCSVRT